MRRVLLAAALVCAFLAGCVATSYLPPAHAGSVVRWEYHCIDAWSGVTHSANQLGKVGWEMTAGAGTADAMMWCFKRPMQ